MRCQDPGRSLNHEPLQDPCKAHSRSNFGTPKSASAQSLERRRWPAHWSRDEWRLGRGVMASFPRRRVSVALSVAIALASCWPFAYAARGTTVVCTDASGNRIATNLPSSRCAAPAGSLTDSERADVDACRRQVEVDTDDWKRKQRRERALLGKFPDEAAHARKRAAEIQPVRTSMQQSDHRLSKLAEDRKPLLAEAEFYVGKPLPAKLASALDANDAAVAAQRQIRASQVDEVARIELENDRQLKDLKLLWTASPVLSPVGVDCVAKVLAQRPRR